MAELTYQILRDRNTDRLEITVSSWLELGWSLLGAPMVYVFPAEHPEDSCVWFAQAIVKTHVPL